MTLDKTDLKLLYELDKDAKQPISAVAKKLRINKNTARFRIRRLLDERVITHFYPVIDISNLGFFSIRVYFKFFNASTEDCKDIFEYLVKQKKVAVVAELDSVFDVMLSVIVKDIYEFNKIWQDFKHNFRDKISDEQIDVFTSISHFPRKYLSQKSKYEFSEEKIGGLDLVDYDSFDLKILEMIKDDSRLSSLELSRKLKMPVRTVLWRIKRLEKLGVIQNYRIGINLDKINRRYFKINVILDSDSDIKKLEDMIKIYPDVIFLERTISKYDLEFDVESESRTDVDSLINLIRKNAKVRLVEVMQFRKYHKLESMPGL